MRTEHADLIVSEIRTARRDGVFNDSTPVVLAGDFNAYDTDPRRHLDTLIRGDISDELRFGEDRSLDPSGVPLVDLLPGHYGADESTWTWRDDTQEFDPYALDRILITGSSVEVIRSFVLNPAILSPDELGVSGLETGDAALELDNGNYDHLPLVADLRLR